MTSAQHHDLLQTVFDTVTNSIVVLQPIADEKQSIIDFSIVLLNAHAIEQLSDKNYKGKNYCDVFPESRQNGVLKNLIEAVESGTSTNFEYFSGIGTQAKWLSISTVLQDNLLIVTIQDITEQRQSETALKAALYVAEKQMRLYDSIIDNTPDLVYVFDLNYRFTYANKALLAMWGKTAEDAIGRGLRENGYEEWHALMHEREIDEIVLTKKPFRGTVAFPHAQFGSRIYDYILVPVLNENGEVEAIAGTTRDITEIKRVEEKLQQSDARFRIMIDQTPAPTLVLMGDDLVIEQINKSMLEMIGHGEEVIGVPLLSIMPELSNQYIWKEVVKVYKEGTPFNQLEVLVTHKRTGTMRDYYYNIAYRPLKEDGKIIGMIQVAIDVTEQVTARKKLEESEGRYKVLSQTLEQQVIERTTELQRSNEDLQQFAHVASHDLKEPIRKIKTFTGRLEHYFNDNLEEVPAKFMERIQVATDRMFTMIDGVLAYSTINAAPQKPELVNLEEVIKNIETDLEIAMQKVEGKIQYNDLPTLEGASVLLYQLFYNLINNSIKFAKSNVPLKIVLSSKKDENDLVIITLSDNGIGFRDDHAEKIFETFTRLNPKDEYEGTGLGLSLCKKIVERHNGRISAKGNFGEGASFIITLPLQQKKESI